MSVLVMFHLMYVYIVFSSVLVAEWVPFRKELPPSVDPLFSLFNTYFGFWLKIKDKDKESLFNVTF